MFSLLDDAHTRAIAYLSGIDARPVAPRPDAVARLSELSGPLPDEGLAPEAVLAMLDDAGSPATAASAGGRYFGFVIGGTVPAALGASWLVSAWDQNTSLRVMSPVGAALEETALAWTCSLLGLPEDCAGALVTGATMANFTCLAAARHHVLARAGWDVEAKGLAGAPPIRVVVGEEAHATLFKALALLGLGRDCAVRVPADGQGRMRADKLPPLDASTILCLQAGNVNTGAFDPAAQIIPAAREQGAWVHVDSAFGLWAGASPAYRHLTTGFDGADSWATDAHKWPNVGYDCGVALVRSGEDLRAAMAVSAAYLLAGGDREPMHYGPESSRRARGVELWAALRSLGRRGMAELVERTCRHARRFAQALTAAGLRVLNDVVINQVLVEMTEDAIRAVQEDGTCWCGGTVWQGRTAMRISVSSWKTTDEDVERSVEAILKATGHGPVVR